MDSLEQRGELIPALGTAHKKSRRLRQREDQHETKKERDGAADEEESPPPVVGKDGCGKDAGEHASQRNANDCGCDRERPETGRRELSDKSG